MSHIFISHASRDGAEKARDLCRQLEGAGRVCWMAPRDVKAGVPYPRQIVEAIEGCTAFILIVTPSASESADILQELQIAHTEQKLIIPVIVDSAPLSADLRYYVGVRHQISWTGVLGVMRELATVLDPDWKGMRPAGPGRRFTMPLQSMWRGAGEEPVEVSKSGAAWGNVRFDLFIRSLGERSDLLLDAILQINAGSMGREEAQRLLQRAPPILVRSRISLADAEAAGAMLNEAGVRVDIVPSD